MQGTKLLYVSIACSIILLIILGLGFWYGIASTVPRVFGVTSPLSQAQIDYNTEFMGDVETVNERIDGKMSAVLLRRTDEVRLLMGYNHGLVPESRSDGYVIYVSTTQGQFHNFIPNLAPISLLNDHLEGYDIVGITINNAALVGRVGRIEVKYKDGTTFTVSVGTSDMVVAWQKSQVIHS